MAENEAEEPTTLEVMQALIAVLTEEPRCADALFIHGSQGDLQLDEKELALASRLYRAGLTPKIILNGITRSECQRLHLAYCGYEPWLEMLVRLDVPGKDIVLLPPSMHTGEEARSFLHYASKHNLKRLTIMAYPHHLLRCFLQIVKGMEELDLDLDVFGQTPSLHSTDWTRVIHRTVLRGRTACGGGDVNDAMPAQIASELERIVVYARPDLRWMSHATIKELLAYLTKRNARQIMR